MYIYLIVLGCPVFRMISVPGRKIYAKFQSIFLAGIAQLAQYVAFPILPSALRNGMCGIFAWPQAKTVVMFRGNNNTLSASGFRNAAPLPAIQLRRIKHFFLFGSFAPFQVGKGIGPKMSK